MGGVRKRCSLSERLALWEGYNAWEARLPCRLSFEERVAAIDFVISMVSSNRVGPRLFDPTGVETLHRRLPGASDHRP